MVAGRTLCLKMQREEYRGLDAARACRSELGGDRAGCTIVGAEE